VRARSERKPWYGTSSGDVQEVSGLFWVMLPGPAGTTSSTVLQVLGPILLRSKSYQVISLADDKYSLVYV
jgi:hypothetical protein